jgi:hypothetical protein
MSAKGNKVKAGKEAPKDPTPKRAPSAGRLPARSPLDDGMRSQMFNLSPALSQRRRSNSPLLPGLTDPPSKKRKAKVSVENTSASAADNSSSAEDTPISASAANKSSSVEDTLTPPLDIRLSEAVDQRLLQLSSSKIPEKEHSAIEGDKGPGNENGNTPLSAAESFKGSGAEGKAKSSRASLIGPWDDLDDEEDLPLPSKIDGEDSLLPALHAEDSQSFNRDSMASNFSNDGRERVLVSDRHKFKSPNLSPKNDREASGENNSGSGVTTDDEEYTSPPPALASSTEKVLNDIIEGTTAYREYIRSGGMPESNAQ